MQPTQKEKKQLQHLLKLAPNPSSCMSYDELLGLLYGLAITPDIIAPSEWLSVIFDDEIPEFASPQQMEEMISALVQTYNRMVTAYNENKLEFPFIYTEMSEADIEKMYEWVSGLDDAMFLREELWDPEESTYLTDRGREELYYSLIILRGLLDPDEVQDFFEALPEDEFLAMLPDINLTEIDKETQIQYLLMAALPLAVETLQQHSRILNELRREKVKQPTSTGKKSKKGNVIKVDFGRKDGKKKALPAYQLKISLRGAKPPIWRRVQVPGAMTLAQLHEVIQLTMGWQNCHLHQFLIDRTCYCPPEKDETWRTSRPKDEGKFTLEKLHAKLSPSFVYIYDFGDDWLHEITVEKVIPAEEAAPVPLLLTGRRACPPEDVGGIPGYMDALEIVQDPDHEEYKAMTKWLGKTFDPARFNKTDIAVINSRLKSFF